MGYMRHHAIIVTGIMPYIETAHRKAADIFGPRVQDPFHDSTPVTPITFRTINTYQSFAVLPDGSKEGWTQSDTGDEKHNEFIAFLEGSSSVDWVEVQFADDGGDDRVIRSCRKVKA